MLSTKCCFSRAKIHVLKHMFSAPVNEGMFFFIHETYTMSIYKHYAVKKYSTSFDSSNMLSTKCCFSRAKMHVLKHMFSAPVNEGTFFFIHDKYTISIYKHYAVKKYSTSFHSSNMLSTKCCFSLFNLTALLQSFSAPVNEGMFFFIHETYTMSIYKHYAVKKYSTSFHSSNMLSTKCCFS